MFYYINIIDRIHLEQQIKPLGLDVLKKAKNELLFLQNMVYLIKY